MGQEGGDVGRRGAEHAYLAEVHRPGFLQAGVLQVDGSPVGACRADRMSRHVEGVEHVRVRVRRPGALNSTREGTEVVLLGGLQGEGVGSWIAEGSRQGQARVAVQVDQSDCRSLTNGGAGGGLHAAG